MATIARPDGYDDDSDDEFEGFEFGDQYNERHDDQCAAAGRIDRDFVPSMASLVKKSSDSTSHQTNPGSPG